MPKAQIGCYVRVSTRDKQTTRMQRAAIREWATRSHIHSHALKWYEDKASGKSTDKRTALAKLLHAVELGRIDTVVVYDLSRLARNTQDGLRLIAELCEKNIRIVSICENIDFGNSAGQLIATILLAVAQFDRETRNEKIRQGIAARQNNGKEWGRKPNNAKHDKIRSLYDNGTGVTQIAEQMQCSRQEIYRSLKRTKEIA